MRVSRHVRVIGSIYIFSGLELNHAGQHLTLIHEQQRSIGGFRAE